MSFVVFAVENADRLVLMGKPIAGQPTLKPIALSYIQAPKLAKRVASGEFGAEEPCAYEAAELIRSTFIGKPVKFVEDHYIDALRRSAGRLSLATTTTTAAASSSNNNNSGGGGEDASEMLLRAGLATVPERAPPRMDKELFAHYTRLMKEAKAAHKGVFARDAATHVRRLRNLSRDEIATLVSRLQGREFLVRVERVLSAAALVLSGKELGETQVAVHMTGIAVPTASSTTTTATTTTKDNNSSSSSSSDAEACAAQGKLHTETLLLHRNVHVRIDGMDSYGNVLASVVSSKGSFQEELLSRGVVTLHEATLPYTKRATQLREAAAAACAAHKGVWKSATAGAVMSGSNNGTATTAGGGDAATAAAAHGSDGGEATTAAMKVLAGAASGGAGGVLTVTAGSSSHAAGGEASSSGGGYAGPMQFVGVLVQVVHADTLVVRDEATRRLVRVSLSGVRSSKNIVRDQDGNAPEARVTYHDAAWQAREFVRERFIGERVAVRVEAVRVMPETREQRPVASVTACASNEDVAVALLERGLATFFVSKGDVCVTAPLLQAAEAKAKNAHKGLYARDGGSGSSNSAAAVKPVTIVELGRLGESRARYYLGFLQRGMQGNRPPVLRGVVDLVLGPSSLRVYVAKENFQFAVKVAGVITPNAAMPGSNSGSNSNSNNNSNSKGGNRAGSTAASAASSGGGDPYAEEARDFVIDLVQQRAVNVQVYTSDRVGNFIASVCLLDGTNLSVALVNAGLATVGNADRLPFQQQLLDAQDAARAARRCVWSTQESRPQRAVKLDAARVAARTQAAVSRVVVDEHANNHKSAAGTAGAAADGGNNNNNDKDSDHAAGSSSGGDHHNGSGHDGGYVKYQLLEVGDDGISVYLQPRDEATEATRSKLQALLDRLGAADGGKDEKDDERTSHDDAAPSALPKKGDVVAALYSAEKVWCRARVQAVRAADAAVEVHYMDYGNSGTVRVRRVRAIPRNVAEYAPLRDTPALARLTRLAFVNPRLPSDAHVAEACEVVYAYTDGDVVAKPMYTDVSGTVYHHVTLRAGVPSLAEVLLQRGLALLDRRAAVLQLPEYATHEAAMQVARKAHKGLWVYGDVDDDEEAY